MFIKGSESICPVFTQFWIKCFLSLRPVATQWRIPCMITLNFSVNGATNRLVLLPHRNTEAEHTNSLLPTFYLSWLSARQLDIATCIRVSAWREWGRAGKPTWKEQMFGPRFERRTSEDMEPHFMCLSVCLPAQRGKRDASTDTNELKCSISICRK